MIIHRTYKYRIYPSVAQIKRMVDWENSLRFLWNLANEQRLVGLAHSKDYRKYYTAFDQMKELTKLRKEVPWLADVPRDICNQILIVLDIAWQRCFKQISKQPRFKKKGRGQINFHECDIRKWYIAENVFRFTKLGKMSINMHIQFTGIPKSCTIIKDVDQWFAVINCEEEIPGPIIKDEPRIGIDRGVVNVVADSNGKLIENPRYYEKSMKKLAHVQRIASRRKKGSKRKAKANQRVAKVHRTIRRQRDLFVHTLSHEYANSQGIVVVENLNIKGMVKANRGLSRGILDAGWGKFVRYVEYKIVRLGGKVVKVPAQYSSQECSCCGCIDERSRQSQSVFHCVHCGYTDHADVNAAKVLLNRANRSALLVEGKAQQGSRRSEKVKKTRASPKSSQDLVVCC